MSARDWGATSYSRAEAQVQHEPDLIPVDTGECEDCGAPIDIEGDCVICDFAPEVTG